MGDPLTTGDDLRGLMGRMSEAEKANSKLFLGRLAWYTIPELCVPHSQVVQALATAGITSQLPLPPRDANVFRRESSKAARRHVATEDPGVFANYRVVDITEKTGPITRRIVRETVNAKGVRLSHDQLIDVVFDRATSGVTLGMYVDGHPPDPEAISMGNEIQAEFGRWKGCLNGYAVREWIRHYLMDMNATKVRDGMYFVRETHVDKIEALETLADIVPGGVVIHSLPLLDDRKQRDMIRKAFEVETSDAITGLLAEISELMAGDDIPETEYSEKLNRFHALSTKTSEYMTLLDETFDLTRTRLQLAQMSVMGMLGKVRTQAPPDAAAPAAA